MTDPQLKLFISSLPTEWNEATIKDYFRAFAPVVSVSVFRDNDRSKPHTDLGCAYVLFEKRSEAEQVLQKLNKPKVASIQGNLTIRWADGEHERLRPNERQAERPIFVEYISTDGRPYYWNSKTGTTQWDKPSNATIILPNQAIAAPVNTHYVRCIQDSYGCNLFVFHLPNEWTENELRNNFGRFGNITSARIMLDKVTGKSRGFGFVSFDNAQDAARAMQAMNGHQEGGKRLKVQLKRESGALRQDQFKEVNKWWEMNRRRKYWEVLERCQRIFMIMLKFTGAISVEQMNFFDIPKCFLAIPCGTPARLSLPQALITLGLASILADSKAKVSEESFGYYETPDQRLCQKERLLQIAEQKKQCWLTILKSPYNK